MCRGITTDPLSSTRKPGSRSVEPHCAKRPDTLVHEHAHLPGYESRLGIDDVDGQGLVLEILQDVAKPLLFAVGRRLIREKEPEAVAAQACRQAAVDLVARDSGIDRHHDVAPAAADR